MNVKLILDGEGSFPELAEDMEAGRVRKATLTGVTALPGGMSSGRTSVAFVGELEDGTKVFMETSLRVFQSAAAGFTGRYGDETGNAMTGIGPDGVDIGWPQEGH